MKNNLLISSNPHFLISSNPPYIVRYCRLSTASIISLPSHRHLHLSPFDSTLPNMFRRVFGIIAATISLIKSQLQSRFASRLPLVVEKLRKTYAPSHDAETRTFESDVTKKLVDWPQVVVTFCFGGGVGFSFVSDQIRCQAPISFDLMLILIALAFSFVFLSSFISAKHPVAAGVLELLGVLLAAAALFTALTIPLTPLFKCVVWIIFTGSVLGIVIVNLISA